MYVWHMKKPVTYNSAPQPETMLQERFQALTDAEALGSEVMVRTQIYLTRAEHQFVSAEAARRGEPMAAVIRGYIDDKMRLPDGAWESNSMLEPTPKDPGFELPADAAINHDHYLYGTPRKYVKQRGKWVTAGDSAVAR
jgi:hypothetical protein